MYTLEKGILPSLARRLALQRCGAWPQQPAGWYTSWQCSWYDGPSRVMGHRPDMEGGCLHNFQSLMLLVNAALVGRAKWGWAEREGPTRRLDLGAVAEDRTLEENRSGAPEGCKAQTLKGEGYESITLR